MAHPPYSRMETEAREQFGKSLEECTDDERMLCEDLAWEYCGLSPTEAAREEWIMQHGYDPVEVDCESNDMDGDDEE